MNGINHFISQGAQYSRGEVHRFSEALIVTSRACGAEATSRNADLLMRAGFVARLGAGLYTLLPLGLRLLNRIETIVRTEMNSLGASEFLSPTLYPKDLWSTTGRWDSIDTLFKVTSRGGSEFCISATAEEVVTSMAKGLFRSYRDLPGAMYQIQTKCRDELRPRSGVVRGREFRMKDLYSFHLDEQQLDEFYEQVCAAYMRIFAQCGIGARTVRTFASGGVFSRFSDEFQLVCDAGEDTIYMVEGADVAINKEVASDMEARRAAFGDTGAVLTEHRAIEVGNTFKLGTRFSDAFDLKVADAHGKLKPVLMCSYGIGTTRLIGAIAEVCNDERGLVWPNNISPYDVHVVVLDPGSNRAELVEKITGGLSSAGVSVLLDDRQDVRAGEKFTDADLIGVPTRVVVGARSTGDRFELIDRVTKESANLDLNELLRRIP